MVVGRAACPSTPHGKQGQCYCATKYSRAPPSMCTPFPTRKFLHQPSPLIDPSSPALSYSGIPAVARRQSVATLRFLGASAKRPAKRTKYPSRVDLAVLAGSVTMEAVHTGFGMAYVRRRDILRMGRVDGSVFMDECICDSLTRCPSVALGALWAGRTSCSTWTLGPLFAPWPSFRFMFLPIKAW